MHSEETIYQGKYISIKKIGSWEFVSRTNISGIVVIIPVTTEGELILVEQYRPPVQNKVLELPAGLAGDTAAFHGEELIDAAKRELFEETGFEAQEMQLLTEGPPSPGICSEEVSVFLAKNIIKKGEGGGDDSEDIIIHQIKISEVESFIQKKKDAGILVDPKLYMGLYFCGTRQE